GLLLGYSRKSAARYAFLLAVPAVFASGLYKAAKEVPALLSADGRAAAAAAGEPSLLAIIVATVVSFALGYMVIVWFMRLIETRTYLVFVVYRVIAGLVLLGLLMVGVIEPLAGTWGAVRPVCSDGAFLDLTFALPLARLRSAAAPARHAHGPSGPGDPADAGHRP